MANHPVLDAMRAAHAALDAVTLRADDGRPRGWVDMADMSPVELREAVRLQASLEGRVAGLRLHTVAAADAGGAAVTAAATDTDAWVATAGVNRSRAWGGAWLAGLLDAKYPHTRAALASGHIGEEHAWVVVRAGERVPEGVSREELEDCEARLVEKARHMEPRRLRRAARRLLEPLSRRLADQHEGDLLQEQERRAERETWLALSDNGDGTWSGRFTIPELHGHCLRNHLEKLSGPRRTSRTSTGSAVVDPTVPGLGDRLSRSEALGMAFVELLEHLPEDGHTRSGITLVVHVEESRLREGVGAATLDTGASLSVAEVRRLACEAGHVPLVLSGASVPVDLGRSARLFSRAQALALSARHDSCSAEGCGRPFAWCELHHRIPWGDGGPTDLANAVPLCGHHHRRVHDVLYEHEWLPDGSVRFRHRWPSRRRAGPDPWASGDERAA